MVYKMKKLSNEQIVFLDLARRGISEKEYPMLEVEILKNTDWNKVIKEAVSQAVPALLFDGAELYREYIPKELYIRWKSLVVRYISGNMKVLSAQNKLIELLEKGGYRYWIIKGLTSAAFYKRQDLRMSGDIDFLIDTDARESLEKTLISDGYGKEDTNHEVHINFMKYGVSHEMHFAVPGIPKNAAGDIIREYIAKKFEGYSICESSFGATAFRTPDKATHALIMILHMQYHMVNEGLGMRHISDWASFLSATANDDFWQNDLLPLLRKTGLFKYACVLTRLSADYLGTADPDWAKDAPQEVADALLYDVLSAGNFGRKDEMRSKSAIMVSYDKSGRLKSLARRLHSTVGHHYPICERVKVLYPVFYFYHSLKYVVLSLCGRRPGFAGMKTAADERSRLYSELRMFEIND